MARIAGVNIPTAKRVEVALTYIHGIGAHQARKIVETVGIAPSTRVSELSEADTIRIREMIDKEYTVEGDLRREVAIGPTLFEQFVGRRRVLLGVIRLEIRPLVVIEAEPLQTFENSPDHLFAGSLDVRVLDAENEFAAGLAGKQPVEQCGAPPADM